MKKQEKQRKVTKGNNCKEKQGEAMKGKEQ